MTTGPSKLSHRQAARSLAERDPVVAELVQRAGLPTFTRPTDTHFATLLRAITFQQLAGAAARTIHARLVAVGLAWRIPMPTPKELSGLGEPYRPYRSVVAWYCWRAVELYGTASNANPL